MGQEEGLAAPVAGVDLAGQVVGLDLVGRADLEDRVVEDLVEDRTDLGERASFAPCMFLP